MNETIGLDEGTLFLILFVFGNCLLVFATSILCKYLNTYYENQRIKEAETKEKAKKEADEKVKRQADEQTERIRAKSQIWVNE